MGPSTQRRPNRAPYPWIQPVLARAATILGVRPVQTEALGQGANGQVFALFGDPTRVMKITAEEKEVRGLLRLQYLAPDYVARIDRIIALGPVTRRPDYPEDPVNAYAILREEVTPLSDEEADSKMDAWSGPVVDRDVVRGEMQRWGVSLYNYDRDRSVSRGWTPRRDQQLHPYWWADNAGFALNYWLHQASSGKAKKAQEQALFEYLSWLKYANARRPVQGDLSGMLPAIYEASYNEAGMPQGAFFDFGLGNLGRTVDGRLVWYDIHWADLTPEPISEILQKQASMAQGG